MTPLSELLKARAAPRTRDEHEILGIGHVGYYRGTIKENERLQPLLSALIEVACAAEKVFPPRTLLSTDSADGPLLEQFNGYLQKNWWPESCGQLVDKLIELREMVSK